MALPEPGKIEFKAFHKKERKNFVMYFDFESIVSTCKSDPDKSTLKYQKHLPCSYCIVTKSEFSDFKDEVITFTDANPDKVTSQFISDLNRIHEKMMLCYKEHQYPIQMTESSEKAFQDATFCSICRKPLDWNEKINYPVRDHDHTKPKNNYRGAAHRYCNINYFERTKKVPVICHNLKGYDLHLFIINLVKATDNLQVIPETIEKFKVVMTEKFIFLDSFAFLSTSLENLWKVLKFVEVNHLVNSKMNIQVITKILQEKEYYFMTTHHLTMYSTKQASPRKINFLTNKHKGTLMMTTICMQKIFFKKWNVKIFVITCYYTLKLMHYYYVIFLKILGLYLLATMARSMPLF